MAIQLKDGDMFATTEKDLAEWQSTYSGIDVRQELAVCAAWNKANPDKRKTARGIRRHINSWLSRAFEKRHAAQSNEPQYREPTPAEREEKRRAQSAQEAREKDLAENALPDGIGMALAMLEESTKPKGI